MKAADKRRQTLRRDAVLRMLAEAQTAVEAIRAEPAPQVSEATRHAAKQIADLAAQELERLACLPAHTSETWLATVNLSRALERAEAVLCAPEAWAGMPTVAEALQLMGAAHTQAIVAERLAVQRSKGRPPDPASKAERIRQASAERPNASSEAISRKLAADGIHVDPRQVRSVRSRSAKQ
jgi:hypothetical protein